MFRRDDDFDEVQQYKKDQQRSEKERLTKERYQRDKRFESRDDFERDDYGYEEEQRLAEEKSRFEKELEKTYQHRDLPPTPFPTRPTRNLPLDALGTVLGVGFVIIIFSIVFGVINNDNYYYEDDMYPMMEMTSMDAKEFIGEYQKASENYLDSDDLHYDTDFDQPFSIDNEHVYDEDYDGEYEEDMACVVDENDNFYICALNPYDIENYYYPEDFSEEVIDANINEIYMYSLRNTNYDTVYFINGFIYSQEYIDLVKSWLKNDGFK